MNFKKNHKLVNGNPTPEACEQVGLIFLTLYDEDNGCDLDMNNGGVSSDPVCGTSACHGGWWEMFAYQVERRRTCIDFDFGAKDLAEFLGFEGRHWLEMWAHGNPILWGNDEGEYVFGSSMRAFDGGPEDLSTIGNWWIDVGSRIAERG